MTHKNLFISFICFCFSLTLFSQPSNKVDSLYKLLEKYPPKTEYTLSDTSKVRVLNALSDKLWHQSEFDKAIIYANEARVICERLLPTAPADQKTKLINLYSSALGNIGVANDFQGKYPEALRFFFECLKLNESIENKDGIATALNNIGIIYYEQRDFEKALKYYNDALKIQEAIGDKQAISFSLNNIGLVYSDMNKIDKALEYYSKSLKLKEAANDKRGIVSALLNISGVYAQNEEYEKTLEYQFKALEVNREVNNKSDDAKLLNNIGKVYLLQKNYAKAIEYCEKAILISREIGVLEEILETEKNLSDIYAESGNPAKAFEHYKAFITARDSLFNVENTKDIVRSEMNFDFEKKQAIAKAEQEKKDAINAEELKQQRMQRNYFIIGFILMIALALFIFKGYTEKKKANTIIAEQKAIVEEKNKDITDSINYAKRIQTAILPSIDSIQLHLPQSFVFYQPKDIVSGDFYWFTEKENRLIFAVADCTGHGVPGAFMSMIGNDMLTQIIIEKGFLEPGQILTRLHEGVKNALKQDIGAGETKDGMDIALISIHKNSNIVEYAGALRPLWLIKPSVQEVTEYKADKHSIGGSASAEERTFTNHVIPFSEGDSIYLSTDGYADQFGGEKGKKYMTKNMKNLLLKIQNKNMNEQKTLVRQSFMEWKKDRSQVDDILVVGIRL